MFDMPEVTVSLGIALSTMGLTTLLLFFWGRGILTEELEKKPWIKKEDFKGYKYLKIFYFWSVVLLITGLLILKFL